MHRFISPNERIARSQKKKLTNLQLISHRRLDSLCTASCFMHRLVKWMCSVCLNVVDFFFIFCWLYTCLLSPICVFSPANHIKKEIITSNERLWFVAQLHVLCVHRPKRWQYWLFVPFIKWVCMPVQCALYACKTPKPLNTTKLIVTKSCSILLSAYLALATSVRQDAKCLTASICM